MPSTMDIDPAALTSRPTISSTPILPPSKVLPAAAAVTHKKASVPARIDLEPLYTSLKAAIGGEHWGEYKEAFSLFVMGQLNQVELCSRIDYFMVASSVETEHLHNKLVAAVLANVTREMPDHGVAGWVSMNDKPIQGAGSKPVSGDAAEQRLKTEIMQLPSRDRRRLKDINLNEGDAFDTLSAMIGDHRRPKAKRVDSVPASAGGGLNKTNWDLEIRKRFANPLASESLEFPDTGSVEARMLPLCYEHGLVAGHAGDAAPFMSVATETFVKEVLSSVFGKTRSNGPGAGGTAGAGGGARWVTTRRYRRQLAREEDACLRGEAPRDKSGLLPVEARAAAERGSLGMADLRTALEMGDCGLGQMRVVCQQVVAGWREGELEDYDDYSWPREWAPPAAGKAGRGRGRGAEDDGAAGDVRMGGTATKAAAAAAAAAVTATIKAFKGEDDVEDGDDVDDGVDEEDWGWEGASTRDHFALDSLLDSCLAA